MSSETFLGRPGGGIVEWMKERAGTPVRLKTADGTVHEVAASELTGSWTGEQTGTQTDVSGNVFANSDVVEISADSGCECRRIGDSAFRGCNGGGITGGGGGGLSAVGLPSATELGQYAFTQCSCLSILDLPAVSSAGYAAFSEFYAGGPDEIRLPALETAGNYFCIYDHNLTGAFFPLLTSVPEGAFEGCSGLVCADVPAAVSIGDRAFWGSGLGSFRIPPGVVSLGEAAFCSCSSLYSLDFSACSASLLSIAAGNFTGNRVSCAVIPDSVTRLADGCFYDSNLLSVRMPSGDVLTGYSYFSGCPSALTVDLSENRNYSVADEAEYRANWVVPEGASLIFHDSPAA